MNKKVFAVCIIVLTLSFAWVVGAQADNAFEITNLEVLSNNVNIGHIVEGELSVKISVKANESGTPLIIALLCNGTPEYYNVAYSNYIDNEPFISGDTKELAIPLVCSDSKDKFIKIMIFDNHLNMHLIGKSVIFPTGEESKITSISINGKEVKNFNKDIYEMSNIEAPYGVELPLDISAETVMNGPEITVIQPENIPGALIVKSAFPGEEGYTYTINLIEGSPLTIDYYAGEYEESSFGVKLIENINKNTQRYGDYSTFSFVNAPEELFGATYIQPRYNDSYNSQKYITTDKWLEFTLKEPATVYYLTSSTYLKNGGFQSHASGFLGDGWNWLKDSSGEISLWKTGEGNGQSTNLYIMKKDINASPDNPVTVTSYANAGESYKGYVYSFAVKWIDNSCDLLNIKIDDEVIPGFSSHVLEYSIVFSDSESIITAEALKTGADVNVIMPEKIPGDAKIIVSKDGKEKVYTVHLTAERLTIDYYGGEMAQPQFSPVIIENMNTATERYGGLSGYTFNDLPEEIIGATYIQPDFNKTIKEPNYAIGEKWIEFTLKEPATVYYFTSSTYYKINGFQSHIANFVADGWQWMTNESGQNAYWTTGTDKAMFSGLYIMKKEVNASLENPVTITSNGPDSGNPYYVYSYAIKWKE